MKLFGPWVERLAAIAVGRDRIAVGGRRDAAGVTGSRISVVPAALLDGKAAAASLDAGDAGAIAALAFAGDELLVGGGDGGRLVAWDVAGQRRVAALDLGAPVCALALDAGAARGDAGAIAVGTADGALHVVALALRDAAPVLGPVTRRALSDGAIAAVAWDAAGLWLAGGADGQLWVIGDGQRAVSPGGDGGIRAVVGLGDGRAAIGCGDGSLRLCYVVGDVEATDRSGDHGHQAAVRGLVLAPVVLDEAGREQPRRLISGGEDGALKLWSVDGNRRPRTIELGIGPVTALGFAPGPVVEPGGAPIHQALGRLWVASARRAVAAIALAGNADPAGEPIAIGSALDERDAQLRDPRAAVKVKLEAVAALAALAEDEARSLLDLALAGGPTEVRVAAAHAMARSERRASRSALRTALGAEPAELRAAAFHALRELERDQPLAAVRAGLAARFDDVRVRAVEALVAPARSSVIAAGMIAEALRDAHPAVRRRAFAALREAARDPADAVRTALARGTPDIRAEALLHLGFVLRAAEPEARALTAGALDDADPEVRRAAFLAAVMQRPALAARLAAPGDASLGDELARVARELGVALELADRGAPLERGEPGGGAPGGTDEAREPLFAALACRHADAALRGAAGLLALGDPRAVGAVLQLTREADPALRRGATASLISALAIWPDDDRLATRLIWLLDDPDAEVASFAFDAVARSAAAAGADAELRLAETALRTSREDIRVRALQVLVRVGAPAGPAARTDGLADRLLGDALDDEAAKVRGEAFRTLWAWHPGEPLLPLTRGAQSRHGDLRGQVVAEIDRRRRAGQSSPELDRLLLGLVGDTVAEVGLAAYAALTRASDDDGDETTPPAARIDVHLAALRSRVPVVRAAGAQGAAKVPAAAARGPLVPVLVQLVRDDHPPVHHAAIEALDAVAPDSAEGFALAFASVFYELQVRAGELCGRRRDARAVAPMQRILAIPRTDLDRPPDAIRQRAARALADAGDPAAIGFQLGLVDDDDPIVREMAARGLATAARPDDTAARVALVGLLGHADLAVRSWAGEGLAKLGDLRALPVLAGTQRHDHRPLRFGAIAGFTALGPDGVRGLRQGLEDRDREIADLAFAVIVARDAALARAGIAPDLLVDAMSSPSPEIRFAAARLFERRAAGDPIDAELIGDLVGPRRPERASDMKDWPAPPRRAALLQVVADAIASDEPGRRYAATQVLALRGQPQTFWREAARLAGPGAAPPAPHTGGSAEARTARRTGWLRRLVGERDDPEARAGAGELETLARLFLRAGQPVAVELAAAQRLVFGVYAGLVRQAPARGASDETHRVRRDAIARLVELARDEAVGADAVRPVLGHALGDPHHLARQAAMAALRSLYPPGALAPLQMAIAGAADLGKAAIDELLGLAAGGDDRARALVQGALDADEPEVRAHAARRLVRLYPAGSVAPQLAAAQSRHADVRLGAIAELASALELPRPAPGPAGDAAPDPTAAIVEALVGALGSEHADLRLRAAVALARRGDPLGIEVLGAFLRSDGDAQAQAQADDALDALVGLAGRASGGPGTDAAGAAAEVIAARLDGALAGADHDGAGDPDRLIEALGAIGHPLGAPPVVRMLVAVPAGKEADVGPHVDAALDAVLAILRDRSARPRTLPDGRIRHRLRDDLALTHLGDLARSPLAVVRRGAAAALGDVDARGAEDVLARLSADRDPEVRVAAAESLALRAEYVPGATLSGLEAALRGGRRELVLPAALGLAARKRPEAFQPLLLVARAGEPAERERAIVALGSLGDRRALDHLLPLLDPDPDDEASRALTPAAAEALGRLLPALSGDEAADLRARLERLATSAIGALRLRALTGLRHAGDLATVLRVAADREVADDVRVHAVEQLGLAAAAATEPALAELLSDDDDQVRDAALAALSRALGGDRTRVSLHALAARHDHISRPAAAYLATAGDPAMLVARLGTVRSPEVRRTLREGLIRRAALPRPELQAALEAEDPVPRAEAAWIAGAAGDAARPLVGAVEAAVARGAAQRVPAAGAAPGPTQLAALDALSAGLWAARRVGAAGAVAVEATAHDALGDDRAPTALRREAAAVLAAAGSGPAVVALTGAIGDADREVRAIAAAALAARPPTGAAAAVRGLGSRADATTIAPLAIAVWSELAAELIREPSTRAWALTVSLADRRLDELIAIATARNGTGRLAAIAALGRLGGDRARQTLEAIHGDTGEADTVRLAAWKALRRIQRGGRKTYAEGQDKGPSSASLGGSSAASDEDEDSDDEDGDDDEDNGGDEDDDEGDDVENDEDEDSDDDDDDGDDEDSDDKDSDDEDSDDEDSDDEDSDDDDEDSDDEDSDDEDEEDEDD